MKKKKENLYEILDKMRERPAMYTGDHSLTSICHFINGFFAAYNNETNELPDFGKFHDFVGQFYGKYSTAGWKNLILADHFGNEEEAIIRFYELLDDFRKGIKYNSRGIVLTLLNASISDLEIEKEHTKDLKDIAQVIGNQMNTAIYGGIIVWYDRILKDVFFKVRDNEFLHYWVQKHTPSIVDYEYEIWSDNDGKRIIMSCLTNNHLRKNNILNDHQILMKRFYAFDEHDAILIKEEFLAQLSALGSAKKNDAL